MNRKRRTKFDYILVALDINDSSRKVEFRVVGNIVIVSEIRVYNGCLDRVADIEATIRSNVVPLDVSPPWSPQPPYALSELRQLLIGKEKAAAIFLIPFTIVLSFCNIG
jgi:hypothetical protein